VDLREPLSRRAAARAVGQRLAGCGAVAALAAAAAGCEPQHAAEPDVLLALEQRARDDAALANSAAAAFGDLASALKVVAAERAAHADALRTEISRAAGVYGDGTAPRWLPAPTVPDPPAVPATAAELRARIAQSGKDALDTAAALTGYRAGMVGSIAAACAAEAEVLLR
jgi:hypothetical protein